MTTLMGIESEYAVSLFDNSELSLDAEDIVDVLYEYVESHYSHLPASENDGLFLTSGAKYYNDYGDHPEFATPECPDPWQLVSYVKAGDLLMARGMSAVAREYGDSTGFVSRGNIGYSDPPCSWATHESYLCRKPPGVLQQALMPHLVTRIVYTGAGGFNPFQTGNAVRFMLSPRTPFLPRTTCADSVHTRGIFHLKDEPYANPPYHRLHVLCGEALGSELSMFLRAATTALVTALAEAELVPFQNIGLPRPVAAMKTIAEDVTCTVAISTMDGNRRTACQIQRILLETAENHIGERWMPDWADAVTPLWRDVLNELEADPMLLADRLDWPMKLALYSQLCRDEGLPWERLMLWCNAYKDAFSREGQEEMPEQVAKAFCHRHGLDAGEIPLIRRVKARLYEADTRFLQLNGGIFESLDKAGVLRHRVVGDPAAAQKAIAAPPSFGRARLRGELVRLLGQTGRGEADWDWVVDLAGERYVPLGDPFANALEWHSRNAEPELQPAVAGYPVGRV